jgi:hypothetical protein
LLARFRAEHSALRANVEAHNARAGRPASYRQIVVYGGQAVLPRDEAARDAERDTDKEDA